jgi:D-xylose transport system substrate-binding protein
MRSSAVGLAVAGVAAALVLGGCGSSSNSNTTSSSTTTTTPSPSASSGTSGGAGGVDGKGGKVGIILPDTKSSNRWVNSDPTALAADCKTYNVSCDIKNANGDATQMKTIAEAMMNSGARVLMIVNLDPASGAAIEKEAKSKGVLTIDYDRLTPGGTASMYVSFDNVTVGTLQGKSLTQCSEVAGKSAANYVDLNGSKTDNNATLFKQGYDAVLSKQAGWKKLDDQSVPNWDNQTAGTIFAGMLQAHPTLNAVMVANDGMANSVITQLTKTHLNGKVAVSGQDATVQGLQHILDGDQCFTIYKPSTGEAGPAVAAAAQLLTGTVPKTTATIKDPTTGREVPSILATPVAITKANINEPIKDGYAPKAQVCAGAFAAKCTAAGVS